MLADMILWPSSYRPLIDRPNLTMYKLLLFGNGVLTIDTAYSLVLTLRISHGTFHQSYEPHFHFA